MVSATPLTPHQQGLINIVRAMHNNLLLARKTKNTEVARRLMEAKIQAERDWEKIELDIRNDVNREISAHEVAEDNALIAAYSDGIPIRQIALEGFGNRLPGLVQTRIRELRDNGLVGNVEGYQHGSDELERRVQFPDPVDVEGIINEKTELVPPTFRKGESLLTLIEDDPDYIVECVILTMDPRDPYFKTIEKNARPGTPDRYATTATLYLHPATGELTVLESAETGDLTWDHPVARWVKDHRTEAKIGFNSALSV